MKNKKILIIASIIAILLSIGVVIYAVTKPKKEYEFTIDNMTLPTSKDIIKDTQIGGLKITNIAIITSDGMSTFNATVVNEKKENIIINRLYIIFYEGDIEYPKLALYDTHISAGKEAYINITSETDLTNITNIEYILE